MTSFPLWPTLYWLGLAACFYYFVLAGGRTLESDEGIETGAFIALLSFCGSGMLGMMWLGYRAELPGANAIAGGVLMACAMMLYEWARRTVRARGFRIAWSGEVPAALCEDGPYRHIRHPLYASYILAFAAMLAALPGPVSLAIFLGNLALFVHAAIDDERAMAGSEHAAGYAEYKQRTGMFVPRFDRRPIVRG